MKKKVDIEILKQRAIIYKLVIAIISIIAVIAIVAVSVLLFKGCYNEPKENALDTDHVVEQLRASSKLITAEVNFKGFAEYTDDGIPVINKGDFLMVYSAVVKAGIDINKVGCSVDNKNEIVYIYVPKAEITDVKVKSDSIKYYNEGFALFNLNEKEDVNKAIKLAEKDAKKDAKSTGILKLANQQSETLIKGILKDVVKGYKMKFCKTEEELEQIKEKNTNVESTSNTN